MFDFTLLGSLSVHSLEIWAYVAAGIMLVVGFATPSVGARVLSAKLRERQQFFERRVGDYKSFVAKEGRAPQTSGALDRDEADLACWAASMNKQASALCLERSQVRALTDAGVLAFAEERIQVVLESSKEDGSDEEEYSLVVKPWMSVVFAALLSICALLVSALGANPVALVLGCLLIAVVGVCVVCDLKTMSIPYQLAYAAYPVALAFAVAARWPNVLASLIGGVACMVLLQLVFAACNRLLMLHGSIKGLGSGDMRLIPAIALSGGGLGSIVGFAASAVVMAVYAVFQMLSQGKGLKSYVPMAPGLFAWVVVGVAVNAGLGSIAG